MTFKPTDLANLKQWLDASQITGLQDGAKVSQWTDLSGTNHHASQSNANYQPTFKANAFSSKPAMLFSGGQCFNHNFDFADNNGGITFFTVTQQVDGTSASFYMAEYYVLSIDKGHPQIFQGSYQSTISTDTLPANGGIITYKIDKEKNQMSVQINNNTTTTAAISDMPHNAGCSIGANSYQNFYKGYIAEIVVYDRALTDDEINQVQNYLYGKYFATIYSESFAVHSKRTVTATESFTVKSSRRIWGNVSESFTVNSKRQVTEPEQFSLNTIRKTIDRDAFAVKSKRIVTSAEVTFSELFTVCSKRAVTLPECLMAQSKRQISTTENSTTKTHRTIAATDIFYASSCRKIAAELKNIQKLSIDIAPKTFSDTFSFESLAPIGVEYRLNGTINDFNYQILASEPTEIYDDIGNIRKYSCVGKYDIDNLLGKYIRFRVTGPDRTAVNMIKYGCNALGLACHIAVDDFNISGMDNSQMVFKDAVYQLFGWTDKVPCRLVNVFVRNDSIYAVQRGRESSVYEIKKYGKVKVKKKRLYLLHDMYDNEGNRVAGTLTGTDKDDDDEARYRNDTEQLDDMLIRYRRGLTVQEQHLVDGFLEVTTHEYGGKFPESIYKTQQTTVKKDGKIVITYDVDKDLNLVKQTEIEYDSAGKAVKTRITRSYPEGLTGDWWTVVQEDNATVSKNIAQGPPSAKITPFKLKAGAGQQTNSITEAPISGRTRDYLGDLPVADEATLKKIAADIEWLDRKIEERVMLDEVKDYTILDFTRRYIWRGNEYYLERNKVTDDSEKIIQQTELVRWYDG